MTTLLERYLLPLDFDGVLHRGLSGTLNKLPLLEDWLRSHPSVFVVISSSWRQTHTDEELVKLFSPDIQPRIVGALPFESMAQRKVDDLHVWLADSDELWSGWVALEDDRRHYDDGPNVVWTDPREGLTEATLQQLSAKFKALPRMAAGKKKKHQSWWSKLFGRA